MKATNVRGLWKGVVELGVDLEAAIMAAARDGTLSPLDCAVLYLYYWWGYSDSTVADELGLSPDQVWRMRQKALAALRDTGMLKGYDQ